MSKELDDIFENNRVWAKAMEDAQPGFFTKLTEQQKPQYMWIGCSDSRVPAESVTHCAPGDLFVHRNIANLFDAGDDNSMSVLEYAVEVLRVKHIIVCGHYGCGGVRASLMPPAPHLPHVNRRIRPLCELAQTHRAELDGIAPEQTRIDRLAELNVIAQVQRLREHPIVARSEPPPLVHGWIFSLADGQLRELESGYEHVSATADLELALKPA